MEKLNTTHVKTSVPEPEHDVDFSIYPEYFKTVYQSITAALEAIIKSAER
jgi:hypothetical protein